MHFQVLKDNFYNEILEKIQKYFPSFSSVFDKEDGVYPILGELGTFIMDNFFNKKIKMYLVILIDAELNIRDIPQRKGGIGTVSEDLFAKELYNFFSKRIKKKFKRIGAFYAGKDAEDKLYAGWRLVTSMNSPKAYDLSKT